MNNAHASVHVVGIGGITCGGKSTLCRRLADSLSARVITLSMDDYYMDDLYIELRDTIENWDCLEAVDLKRLTTDLDSLLETLKTDNSTDVLTDDQDDDETTSTTTTSGDKHKSMVKDSNDPATTEKSATSSECTINARPVVVLLDGIFIYQYPPLQKYFNLRYFITLSKDEAFRRRMERRYTYATGEEVIFDRASYFEQYAWPGYLDSLRDAESQVEDGGDIRFLNGSTEINVSHDLMLRDINGLLNNTSAKTCASSSVPSI